MVSKRDFHACLPALAIAIAWLTPSHVANGEPREAALKTDFSEKIEPLLVRYCYDCHGDGVKKGELALDSFPSIAAMQENRDVWKRVREHIELRIMPPPDEDQPGDSERSQLLSWIDAAVFPIDPANPDPGRILIRRLNREEYRNTIRDLLQVDVEVESVLPPDDSGYSFDNIGDVLTLSPVHIERYLTAARQALDMAVHLGEMPRSRTIPGQQLNGPGRRSEKGHFLHTVGEASGRHEFPRPGRYRIHVIASGTPGGGKPPQMDLRLEDQWLTSWEVPDALDRPGTFTREIQLDDGGWLSFGVRFPNDFWDETLEDAAQRDRNLLIKEVVIEGPMDGPPPPKPKTHQNIYDVRSPGQDDRAYAIQVLTQFARRAFRRPVPPSEIERYLRFIEMVGKEGGDVEQGIRLALEAMLVSPSFIFREEVPIFSNKASGVIAIDEFALASRMSFFLWSSTPDERLLELAEAGQLREHLGEEITRMIKSPKSKRLVSNFGGQWLQLRNLVSTSPDSKLFPHFRGSFVKEMTTETEMLLTEVLQNNLPVITLLDADYTFINESLAKHYGIEGVSGREFRKVSLVGTPRRGILGHGSVLTVTSYPTRTSPVLRGKYVLENLLDITPPPPPPSVPQLGGGQGKGMTVRQQLERHREDPSCSSCHALMDPIGFGLEGFDAVGAFREAENGAPIDTSGQLVSGHSFATAEELRAMLVSEHREQFHRAVATKMLTYALGRGLEWYDRPAVDEIVTKASADEGRLQTFVRAVIDSVPFQFRRASNPP